MPTPPTLKEVWSKTDAYNITTSEEDRKSVKQREAMVLVLFTLYNEYPLRPEEMGLMPDRIQLVEIAQRGWFKLLEREADGIGVPVHRIISAITLLT